MTWSRFSSSNHQMKWRQYRASTSPRPTRHCASLAAAGDLKARRCRAVTRRYSISSRRRRRWPPAGPWPLRPAALGNRAVIGIFITETSAAGWQIGDVGIQKLRAANMAEAARWHGGDVPSSRHGPASHHNQLERAAISRRSSAPAIAASGHRFENIDPIRACRARERYRIFAPASGQLCAGLGAWRNRRGGAILGTIFG